MLIHSDTKLTGSEMTSGVDAEKIAKLVDMGFSEDQARKALLLSSDSVELAASLLFEGGQL